MLVKIAELKVNIKMKRKCNIYAEISYLFYPLKFAVYNMQSRHI